MKTRFQHYFRVKIVSGHFAVPAVFIDGRHCALAADPGAGVQACQITRCGPHLGMARNDCCVATGRAVRTKFRVFT
jgi:hypothetical protein